MAQPNVVREPSMDEILASIRRIIESNEPVTQASVSAAMAEPEGFSGHPANDDTEEVTLTVDQAFADQEAFDPIDAALPVLRAIAETETRAESAAVRDIRQSVFTPAPTPPPQKALSLADVAARVRAASERSSGGGRDMGYAQPAAETVAPVVVAEPEPVAAAYTPAPETPYQMPDMDENREVYSHPEPAAAEPAREEPKAFTSEPTPVSLLSSMAGEQVARSFQDLALAIDSAERRSLDQIAEDMLRPMLQEWLDDNLPTLVERLVREEIERVARGPRR